MLDKYISESCFGSNYTVPIDWAPHGIPFGTYIYITYMYIGHSIVEVFELVINSQIIMNSSYN